MSNLPLSQYTSREGQVGHEVLVLAGSQLGEVFLLRGPVLSEPETLRLPWVGLEPPGGVLVPLEELPDGLAAADGVLVVVWDLSQGAGLPQLTVQSVLGSGDDDGLRAGPDGLKQCRVLLVVRIQQFEDHPITLPVMRTRVHRPSLLDLHPHQAGVGVGPAFKAVLVPLLGAEEIPQSGAVIRLVLLLVLHVSLILEHFSLRLVRNSPLLFSSITSLQLGEMPQLGVELLQGVSGDDLGQHQGVQLVRLVVVTEQPGEVILILGVALSRLHHCGLPVDPSSVAVDADDEAALAAGPVLVEESRLADVAHLPHSLHHSLPGGGQLLGVELRLLLSLVDLVELSREVLQDQPGSLFVHVLGTQLLAGQPELQILYLSVLFWITETRHSYLTIFGVSQPPESVETTEKVRHGLLLSVRLWAAALSVTLPTFVEFGSNLNT